MRLTIISNARNKPIYTCLAEVNIVLDAKYVNRAIKNIKRDERKLKKNAMFF